MSVEIIKGRPGATSEVYRDPSKPLQVVSSLDLEKYLGDWYQIARFPIWFEENAVGDTVHYEPLSENEIKVVNSCFKGSLDGPIARSIGRARVERTGVLSVTFVEDYPKEPNYYIMAIKGDYDIAVIGHEAGTSGWINARHPQISEEDYQWALGVLEASGYDVSKIEKTLQPEMGSKR